jgi:hypothetical protein
MRGGVYRRPRTIRKLKQRPVGLERPRYESRFEFAKRNTPKLNAFVNTIMTNATKKIRTKKPKIKINLTKNIVVQKDTTYQYLKNINRILKQIVKDAERAENLGSEHYDVLVDMASEISQVLPQIKQDIGVNSNSNMNNNNNLNAEKLFDDVEEIIEIIQDLLQSYDRALRKGKMSIIERVESEMELVALTLDGAIQGAKTRYVAEPINANVNDLSMMFNSFKPFAK